MVINRKTDEKYPDFGKVAVMMGGWSAEREVSLQTGKAVHAALVRRGVNAHLFDTKERSLFQLVEENYDRAFIALHGRGGEDGVIQGALEAIGIPYTGSGVLGSALAMDKIRSKLIWREYGLLTPDFIEIRDKKDLEKVSRDLGLPVMIKPAHEGSSCGATKVSRFSDLEDAWSKANALDPSVLVERWVEGKEYTAAVLEREVLPFIRLETPREFYDYDAKYIADTTQYICPCGLEAEYERQLAGKMMLAFDAIGASGWGRVDFIMDSANKVWLIEINTIPGMTDHSLVPMAAKQAGIDFDTLVMTIMRTSINRFGTVRGILQ